MSSSIDELVEKLSQVFHTVENQDLRELAGIIEQRNITAGVLNNQYGANIRSNALTLLSILVSPTGEHLHGHLKDYLYRSIFSTHPSRSPDVRESHIGQFVSVYRRIIENEALIEQVHQETPEIWKGAGGVLSNVLEKLFPFKESNPEFYSALRSMFKLWYQKSAHVVKQFMEICKSLKNKPILGDDRKAMDRLIEITELRYNAGEDLTNIDDIFECLRIYGKVPHCTLIRTLGEGADSVVYHAHHEFLGEVKVKVFKDNPEDKIKEAMEKEGITLEERIKRRIALFDKRVRDRSHIAQLYEVGRTSPEKGEETIYIVSDYVDGGAAEEKVNGQYRIREDITQAHIKGILSKVLAGLGALHNAERILKDVKLRNILVSEDHTEVLIDDLETVTDVTSQEYSERLTEGSDRYAAPEVMADIRNASKRSDLYSAVVCMLYVRTRKTRFIADINKSNADVYFYALDELFQQEGLNDREKKFFRKGLAYDPNERFQTAEELKTAMEKTF